MQTLKLYGLILPIFLLIDLIWLGVIMAGFYDRELGDLARRGSDGGLAPRWGAAALVYLLIPAGIVLFLPAALGENATWKKAFAWGAIYGLIVYGVYDLTNLSVLAQWSLRMTLFDIVWGCVLCGTMSVLLAFFMKWQA